MFVGNRQRVNQTRIPSLGIYLSFFYSCCIVDVQIWKVSPLRQVVDVDAEKGEERGGVVVPGND
jgi:hypothetical protein